MALFSKRLTCFYCGRRASQPVRGLVRKFHCEHCEADNYLDKVRFARNRPTLQTETNDILLLERRHHRPSR
jgi:hypothetical protein